MKAAALAEAARISARFAEAGAEPFEADILQPAATLLDLYGEDIRARAYVTTDPLRGELMLRPDFTLPVVEMHMARGADPARYRYQGEVFRRQETDDGRPSEYLQVGYEVFDRSDPAAADAEVFSLFSQVLDGVPATPVTGDIGILIAAVRGLSTSEARKAALMRHIWRPARFRALLDRYSGRTPVPPTRQALLQAEDPMQGAGLLLGLRGADEIAARIEALRADAAEPPLGAGEVAVLGAILTLKGSATGALAALRDLIREMPAIAAAIEGLDRRLDALGKRGVEVDSLAFEASHGRSAMEYYDGFVFSFQGPGDLPPLATGGRYDALTRVLGRGRSIPAVGGVIRPDLVVQAREARG
ncbi:ATP phosphoribosyltransferase regulatory subunit [Frigidibacter sp. ROC022]|uniref:ATP phosphoribosyltransferase regulatory subunit n=1 Tax=Frigidibacter sp. ROC022 TaxID=2971796 RepID=UPI00215B18C1|nr:ATP phosphoribosyltransferase regulatory subunit [Frigidibacter sp. ROC022]MCR8722907.1 ATP phosphoribosyltransferase regulatory subunit [Frigidibacter sp. ROC022]